jgi:hypothetical protein
MVSWGFVSVLLLAISIFPYLLREKRPDRSNEMPKNTLGKASLTLKHEVVPDCEPIPCRYTCGQKSTTLTCNPMKPYYTSTVYFLKDALIMGFF